jgi:hypothetical protein
MFDGLGKKFNVECTARHTGSGYLTAYVIIIDGLLENVKQVNE